MDGSPQKYLSIGGGGGGADIKILKAYETKVNKLRPKELQIYFKLLHDRMILLFEVFYSGFGFIV